MRLTFAEAPTLSLFIASVTRAVTGMGVGTIVVSVGSSRPFFAFPPPSSLGVVHCYYWIISLLRCGSKIPASHLVLLHLPRVVDVVDALEQQPCPRMKLSEERMRRGQVRRRSRGQPLDERGPPERVQRQPLPKLVYGQSRLLSGRVESSQGLGGFDPRDSVSTISETVSELTTT